MNTAAPTTQTQGEAYQPSELADEDFVVVTLTLDPPDSCAAAQKPSSVANMVRIIVRAEPTKLKFFMIVGFTG